MKIFKLFLLNIVIISFAMSYAYASNFENILHEKYEKLVSILNGKLIENNVPKEKSELLSCLSAISVLEYSQLYNSSKYNANQEISFNNVLNDVSIKVVAVILNDIKKNNRTLFDTYIDFIHGYYSQNAINKRLNCHYKISKFLLESVIHLNENILTNNDITILSKFISNNITRDWNSGYQTGHQVGTTVGAAIGGYCGGWNGASVGATVGGAIGGAIGGALSSLPDSTPGHDVQPAGTHYDAIISHPSF